MRAKENDDIHVEIDHADVVHERGYAALSYVWGDRETNAQRVIINKSSTLKITYNLWQALRRIRAEYEDRVVWADAICINQDDDDEKASQIRYMPQIYPQASRVLCWLGDDDGTAAEAFVLLEKWSMAYSHEAVRYQRVAETKMELAKPASARSNALGRLCSRPYFQRAWCLQEVCVDQSKPPQILCGEHEISWSQLYFAILTIFSTLDSADTISMIGENVQYIFPMMSICFNPGNKMLLSHLLPRSGDRKAERFHDKIFSLLGLAERCGIRYPAPSYRWSESEVCTVYTRAIMERDQRLDILGFISPFREGDELPSWSLKPYRLRKSDSDSMLGGGNGSTSEDPGYKYGAAGRLKPFLKAACGPLDPILQIFGFDFDQITSVIGIRQFWEQNLLKDGRCWSEILDVSSSFCSSRQLPEYYGPTGESITRAFLRTLTVDNFWITSRDERYWFARDRFYAAYQAHMRGESREDSVTLGAQRTTIEKDQLITYMAETYRFEKTSSGAESEGQSAGQMGGSNNPRSFLEARAVSELRTTVATGLQSRKLIFTTRGYIGIGPVDCQEGDVVCILPGSTVPLILRPAESNTIDRIHYLIGDAYVHGIMYGEAVDGIPDITSTAGSSNPAGSVLFRIV